MVTQSARDRGKSASAFRTIGEVSIELDLPQHVLRFWESKFARLRPMKRGGGRRYYRPEDIELLQRIKQLLYEDGYTIKGVQKLMRERNAKPGQEAARETEIGSPAATPQAKPKHAPAPPPVAAAGGIDAETKKALRDIMAELEELRGLLKDDD